MDPIHSSMKPMVKQRFLGATEFRDGGSLCQVLYAVRGVDRRRAGRADQLEAAGTVSYDFAGKKVFCTYDSRLLESRHRLPMSDRPCFQCSRHKLDR